MNMSYMAEKANKTLILLNSAGDTIVIFLCLGDLDGFGCALLVPSIYKQNLQTVDFSI